jgi:hypothetical protein
MLISASQDVQQWISMVLRRVEQLLGNDREISSYSTIVAK